MKSYLLLSLIPLLLIVPSIAFGDVTIYPVEGSGSPGCEDTTLGCYTPSTVSVEIGDKIIMKNTDSAAHTFTSGDSDKGPDGVFDTSLLMTGGFYEWVPTNAGEQRYFCMVHPWMQGLIVVNGIGNETIQPEIEKVEENNDVVPTIEPEVTIQNQNPEPEPIPEPEPEPIPEPLGIASFVDQSKDPQYYIDRYNNESKYKEWFDNNYPQYESIYQAVGLESPNTVNYSKCGTDEEWLVEKCVPKCTTYECQQQRMYLQIENNQGNPIPESGGMIEYNNGWTMLEEGYAEFDKGNFEKAISIFKKILVNTKIDELVARANLGIAHSYHAMEDFEKSVPYYLKSLEWSEIGDGAKLDLSTAYLEIKEFEKAIELMEDLQNYENIPGNIEYAKNELEKMNQPICGAGTILKDGKCILDKSQTQSRGGGCLIATATFDSELAPQVQKLREIRDSKLLKTESGSQFMESFNQFYYSFSPIIADYERENPVFKEIVKIGITPMLSTLSLMDYADTESEVLGIGISLIILNAIMYVGLPVFGIVIAKKRF